VVLSVTGDRTSLIRRAETEPSLWASLLATVEQREGLDEVGIGSRLIVTPEAIARLALCRRPRSGREADDLDETARYVGTSAVALASLYWLGQALEALSNKHASEGLRQAARRRADDE
jgi:hypothetical protein